MAYNRKDIIDIYSQAGYGSDEINKKLKADGYDLLNKVESQQVNEGLYGKNFIQRAGADFSNIARGLSTAAGAVGKYVTDPEYAANVASVTREEFQKGLGGVTKDVANLLMSPYNVDVDKIKSQPLTETVSDIGAGMFNHPVMGYLDIVAPTYGGLTRGARALGKAGGAVDKAADIVQKSDYIPQLVKDLIPNEHMNDVNLNITGSKAQTLGKENEIQGKLQSLKNVNGDLPTAIRNAERGLREGDEATLALTDNLKSIQQDYQSILRDLGVSDNAAIDTTINQYIFRNLPKDIQSSVPVDYIAKALAEPTSANLSKIGITPDELINLVDEAATKINTGDLFPISHRYSELADKFGVVSDADRLAGQAATRRIGQAGYNELANNFEKAYSSAFNEAFKAKNVKDSFRGLAEQTGQPISVSELVSRGLGKNERVISPGVMDEIIKAAANEGKLNKTEHFIKKAAEGINESNFERFANDLYIVNKNDLRALENAFKTANRSVINKASNLWKRTALATPRYVIGNRLGNAILNTVHGTLPTDYLAGLNFNVGKLGYKGKYADLLPERLRADTSYQGIIGATKGTSASDIIKQGVSDIKQGLSDSDYLKALQGLTTATTGPIFRLESILERADRYGNLIKQARQYAKANNTTVEKVLKEANQNPKVYNQLIKQTNKEMGDYIGRNYYVDPRIHNAFRDVLLPFYKFPTTSMRSLYELAANKPLNYQLYSNLPSKIGNTFTANQIASGLPEAPHGGVLMEEGNNNRPTTYMYNDSNPLSAGAEFAGNLLENPYQILQEGHSPIMDIVNILNYRNSFGSEASAPNTYTAGGTTYVIDNEGNPLSKFNAGPADISKLFMASFTNTYTPISMYNSWIGPAAALLSGQTYYPRYDTSILGQIGESRAPEWARTLYSGKDFKKGRTGKDILMPWMYFRQEQVYPKKREYLIPQDYRNVYKKQTLQQAEKEMSK